jgi:hypothetical protein
MLKAALASRSGHLAQPGAHIRLMFLVKMAEEGRPAQRLAFPPVEAPGVEQVRFGKGAEGIDELLKDSARPLKHVGKRLEQLISAVQTKYTLESGQYRS